MHALALLALLATDAPVDVAQPHDADASADAPADAGTAAAAPPTPHDAAHEAPSDAPHEAPSDAPPATTTTGPRWTRPGWGFGGVPAIAYNPDAGLQLGVVANLYDYDGKTQPYRNQIHLLILVSTKLVQHHDISLDAIDPFDLPLRLNVEVGFVESLTQAYCGVGLAVTCDDAVAEKNIKSLGLTGDAADAYLRHFYELPYIEPYASVNTRFRLHEAAGLKIELAVGWRGADYIPGTIFDDDKNGKLDLFPYPGSLYANDFPGGEPGFLSIFQTGIVFDHRDNEPSPHHGWLAEASVRGSHPFVGSTWTYGGGDVTLRGYTPVIPGSERLVLAGRLILDGVVGDPPILEMAHIGGTVDYTGYGGGDLGRGIRGQRYLGRVKLLEQQELRWHFYEFDLFNQHFGLSANAFLDAGLVAVSFDDLFGSVPRNVGAQSPTLPVGMGGAFLISWNETFIVRLDVATSAVEGWSPYPYITLGQSF